MGGLPSHEPVVGLVGCGRWGRHILRDLRTLGCGVPVVARSPESITRARDGGAARIVPRVEDLAGVDALVIASTTASHADVLEEALDLGVPVFVEKPLTDDPDRAEALARRAGARLYVMDKWRHHPAVLALRDIARSGELGAPTGLVTRRESWGHPHTDVDAVWVLAPHDLAAGLEILGHLPPAREAFFERVGGEVVGMHARLGDAPWLSLGVTSAAPAHHRSMRLLCEEGVAWFVDGWTDHVMVARAGAADEPERRPAEGELPLLAELRVFVAHLAGGPPPPTDGATGAACVRLIADLRALAGERASAPA